MKVLGIVLLMLLGACSTPTSPMSNDLHIGVWCSSHDDGKTCWAYGESYPDGTGDSCGRLPDYAVDFAFKLDHDFYDGQMCETVVASSHPKSHAGWRALLLSYDREIRGRIYLPIY